MRIIAGECHGRRLVSPKGRRTRPITDRVKQAVFSSLGSLYGTPGQLPPLCVLDLFAGPGSLGLEALSRGARLCCFVEKDKAALQALHRNIEALEMGGRCWILAEDAFSAELPHPPIDSGWELAFVDPPYELSELIGKGDPVPRLLAKLADHDLLAKDAVVLLRHHGTVQFPRRIGTLMPYSVRTYGKMAVTWFRNER